MRDVAERALDQVPGWSGASVTPLEGGTTGTTWLAEKGGRRATLKADPSPRGFPFATRTAEAAVQQQAAEQGLATRVIHASPTVLLTEFADGVAWTADDLRKDESLASLGRLLRRVHRLPLTGRRFDVNRAADLYAGRIAAHESTDPACVDEQVAILRSLPTPADFRCCHNDVVAGNILATPELQLIDWEYAADNDPMFDLAIVIAHHDLDDAQADRLLDAYAQASAGRFRCRLAREVRRYRALAWLWQAARP